jgi:thiamine biosynthesis lipoprotein
MGTTAHVVVVGDRAATLVDGAAVRLAALERRWSRFLPTSDISRCNALGGSHVVVSPETVQLVRHAVAGWTATDGRFDPTILPALRALGYDRDFAAVAEHAAALSAPRCGEAPGCGAIEYDEQIRTVTLPPGVEFDPGGIGKGFAADLVCEQLVGAGARGALVNVGGDLRAHGDPPNGASWDVAIVDPAQTGREVTRVALLDGAVATSSRARRRWLTASGPAHHLLDPRTGLPARTRHATVSVIAGTAWWAEVVSKAVLVAGLDVDVGAQFNARVVTIDDNGVTRSWPGFEDAA